MICPETEHQEKGILYSMSLNRKDGKIILSFGVFKTNNMSESITTRSVPAFSRTNGESYMITTYEFTQTDNPDLLVDMSLLKNGLIKDKELVVGYNNTKLEK